MMTFRRPSDITV